MDGFLNINKPAGMTSHDVVRRVRRVLKTKRVGHAGTLDPDATGVLVVAVGQATRLLPHLPLEPKQYTARVGFGAATDTEDASGQVTEEADASALTMERLVAALGGFVGTIQQVPPMVSALHHQGQRLYDLARQGITVEREPRPITVFDAGLKDFEPGPKASVSLWVRCSGGTYIRTLCKDLGLAVGLPAHMATLVRSGVGPFRLDDALTLETLAERGASALLPMERALPFASVAVSDADAEHLRHGRAIAAPQTPSVSSGDTVSLLYREQLLALACLEEAELRPFKVFTAGESA